MSLVIDSSSPAVHAAGGSTPANTCAAFIPPDSSLLLAMWVGDSNHFSVPATPTVASSPSQSWVTDGWEYTDSGVPAIDGQAAVFHAVVSGSPGSSTVTVTTGETASGQQGSLLKVYVILGHSLSQPIGVVGAGRQSDGSSVSDSYTGSITGGQGFMAVEVGSNDVTSGWTANTGCTMEDKGTLVGELSYAFLRRTNADGVLGATTPLGMSGLPAGGLYHWVYLEVICQEAPFAAEGQAGYPARGPSPPMF